MGLTRKSSAAARMTPKRATPKSWAKGRLAVGCSAWLDQIEHKIAAKLLKDISSSEFPEDEIRHYKDFTEAMLNRYMGLIRLEFKNCGDKIAVMPEREVRVPSKGKPKLMDEVRYVIR